MSRPINYPTAELAKLKGFIEPTEGYYYPSAFHRNGVPRLLADEAQDINKTHYDRLPTYIPLTKYDYNSHHPDADFYSAPRQSDLQTWLRDKFKLHIYIDYKPNIQKWDFMVYDLNMTGREYCVYALEYGQKHGKRRFDTYEDAVDAGLEEALQELPNKI